MMGKKEFEEKEATAGLMMRTTKRYGGQGKRWSWTAAFVYWRD